jgi:hypothetical protein
MPPPIYSTKRLLVTIRSSLDLLSIYKTLQLFASFLTEFKHGNYLIRLLKMPILVAWFSTFSVHFFLK